MSEECSENSLISGTLTVAGTFLEARDVIFIFLDVLNIALNLLEQCAASVLDVDNPCLTIIIAITGSLTLEASAVISLVKDCFVIKLELSTLNGTLAQLRL